MGSSNSFKNENPESRSPLVGFILFNSKQIDWEAFNKNLENDWDIKISEKPTVSGQLVFEVNEMMVACGFVEAPVPDNEAKINAKNNFLWKEAVEVTETHKSHAMLSVMNGTNAIEENLLFTKVACSLLKLSNAIGIYQIPTVMPSKFYIDVATDIKEGYLPILDWIYFGVYPDGDRFSGYTVGLNKFGKDEIEVIKTKESPNDLYGFLLDIAGYIIEMNVTLKHGETIGFTEEQKLKITHSKGVAVENESLKIEF